jgi:hypothetical protein
MPSCHKSLFLMMVDRAGGMGKEFFRINNVSWERYHIWINDDEETLEINGTFLATR